jgi:hypothetical protein
MPGGTGAGISLLTDVPGGTGAGMSLLSDAPGGTGAGISRTTDAPGGTGAGMSQAALAIGAPTKTAAAIKSNVRFAIFTFCLLIGGIISVADRSS